MNTSAIKQSIEHKHIILKALLFLSIVYFLIPKIFTTLSQNKHAINSYTITSFATYSLILIIFFAIKYRKDLMTQSKTRITKESIFFSILSIALFTGSYYASYSGITFSGPLFALATILYLTGAWALSVVFFTLKLYEQKYYHLLIFCMLVYFFFIITEIMNGLWHQLSITTATLTTYVLKTIYTNVTFIQTANDPILAVNNFKVIIGPACSGMESISLFIGLFLMLWIYEGEQLHKIKATIIFILGLIGTYILNIIRISLIMVIGQTKPEFAIGVFHSQVGWILFSIFILLLLTTSYKWIRKTPQKVPLITNTNKIK